MEIRMLGPLELIHDNQQVKLAGPRAQIALAVLALEANRIVSVDRLVAALWNGEPPSTARGQIQICVSALRRTFNELDQPGLITTRPPGYILKVSDEMIDARMFDRHLETAAQATTGVHLDEAAAEIRAALELWRGPVLAGLDSEILLAAGQRFDERRLTAIEDLYDIDLAGGRHADIAKLRLLAGEHPLREHLHAQLMIALHRSGRQAEALEAYRNARAVLVEELGIEPGEELRRLEHNILTGQGNVDRIPIVVGDVEPVREQPAAVPRLLPADIADFTGREELLDEIADVLADDDARSAVPVLALSGTGGVGKSALAVRAAQRVAKNFPDGQLYANLQGATANPIPSDQLLFSFLRVLGVSPNAIADDLDGRADLFRSQLSDRRVLIVLDDAGAESQVAPLLPGSARCAVLVTSRPRLVGLPGAHHVDVTTLPSDRAVELVSRIAGEERIQAEPTVSAELAHLCGHLPLALRIAGAKLVRRPHWRVSELVARLDEARRLDELVHGDLDVRASIALSYEGLNTAARQLLRRLAILDAPHVASWVAAALLDTAVEPAQDLLEVLGEAELLEPFRDQTTGEVRYRFHELVRLFGRERMLEEESPAERTETLRRALSAWLTLAEEAHHAQYGGDYTLLHSSEPRWATFSPPAAAIIRGHPIAWLDSERDGLVAAVRQAAAAGFDELCWDLAMTSVTLFEIKAYYDDWRDVTDVALSATDAAGNRRGRAAMLSSAGERYIIQQRYDEAFAALLPALEQFVSIGDRHGQALVRRSLTFIDRLYGDTAGAYARYAALVDEFDAVDDQIAKAQVLMGMARIKLDDGDASTAEDLLADALAIALNVGSRRVEAQVRHALGEAYLAQGAFEYAAKAFHWVLRIVRHSGDEIGETYALHGLGMVRHLEGRYADAEASLTSALRIARWIGEPLVEARVLHRADRRTLTGAAGARAEHLRL